MAETVDLTVGGTTRTPAVGHPSPIRRVEKIIDFAVTPRDQNDVLQLFHIPANCRVKDVYIEVLTAEGDTATVEIGDGSDSNGYLDAVDINSAAFTMMTLLLTEAGPNTITRYTNGKLYTATDTVDLKVLHATGAEAAKIRVGCTILDMTSDISAT